MYINEIWFSPKDLFVEGSPFTIEMLKPISKEDFYRTDYTKEEAAKIEENYRNHYLQNAPSEP